MTRQELLDGAVFRIPGMYGSFKLKWDKELSFEEGCIVKMYQYEGEWKSSGYEANVPHIGPHAFKWYSFTMGKKCSGQVNIKSLIKL